MRQETKQAEQPQGSVKADYDLMKIVGMVMKKQISEAIKYSFLFMATFGTLGFGVTTALDVMASLFTDFGNLTPLYMDTNNKRTGNEDGVKTLIDMLFKNIEKGVKSLQLWRGPHILDRNRSNVASCTFLEPKYTLRHKKNY